MSDPSSLAPGYALRPPLPDDAAAVHALIVASETAEFGEAVGNSLEELEAAWRTLDLPRDAWMATAAGGEIVGYAYVQDRRHVRIDSEGYVHPDHTGRGIGRALVRAAEARAHEHLPLAPAGARVAFQSWINAGNQAACALLESEGLVPARFFFHMELPLDDPTPEPAWPDGIALRPFEAERDEAAAYRVVQETFADHWGHVKTEFDEWIALRRNYGIDPDLWFLAWDGDEPAAVNLCSVNDGIGWVDTLGVRRPWRGGGLGRALLLHAFADFRARGLGRAALGVDAASPTGATRLYEAAGMRATQEHAVYQKELRPGRELAELDR